MPNNKPPAVNTTLHLSTIIRAVIISALVDQRWNRTHTARRLGVSVRTIRNKIQLYRRQGYRIPDYQKPYKTNPAGEK